MTHGPHNSNTAAKHEGVDSQTQATNDVDVLRQLLLGRERAELLELRAEIDALTHRLSDDDIRAAETSEILAAATRLSHQNSEQYSTELKPIVVEQFQTSARENPEVMAEALFPILGPAIRKMIVNMITPDKNKTKRTYKFEQLFLIEKETGLPICHASSDVAEAQDADMVSGMLSAIQSFVQDAFQTQEFDSLNTLQLGDLSVWIEWGPSAVIAAVIRGAAPERSRSALQLLLEDIHQDYHTELHSYDGDAKEFKPIETEFLLFMDNHDSRLRNRVRNMSTLQKRWWAAAACIFVALFAWVSLNQIDKARWNEFVNTLNAQPGIVVTDATRANGLYTVHGLRDPLASMPEKLLADTKIDADKVTFKLEPYQAADSTTTLKRLRSIMVPPENVAMELNGSELLIHGATSKSWIEQARSIPKQFFNITHVTFTPAN